MRKLIWGLALAGFLVNPNLACTADENDPAFQYSESEMRSAVVGTWHLTIDQGAGPMKATLRIEQGVGTDAGTQAALRPLIRAAHACGTRTFVRSAQACIDMSRMPLAVTMVEGDSEYAGAQWSGTFDVDGLAFSQGQLHIQFGDSYIFASLKPNGSVTSVSGRGASTVVTLARVSQ